MKKRILALLLALTLLVPGGCTVQIVESSVTTLQELADAALSEETEAPESGEQFVTAEDPEVTQTADTVGEHGYYYDAEHVVLYLDAYGHLPDNYMTKEEARVLGWEGGSVEAYQAGTAISPGTSSPRRRPGPWAGRVAPWSPTPPAAASAATASATARGFCRRKQEEPIPNATSTRSARISAGRSA